MKRTTGALALSVFSMTAFTLPSLAEVTVGPVTDAIGVVEIYPGDPVVIAGYAALSGSDFTAGIYEQNGMTMAVEDFGTLLDHPIQLMLEDAPCTPEGGQLGATKISASPEVVAAMGPSCSSSAAVGAPILWNVGIPSIGTGPSATALTAPDRAEGMQGFARVIPTSLVEAKLTASYLVKEKGITSVATIHDGSSYAEQFVGNFITEFTAAGGTVTATEAIAATDTDMRPVLTRIGGTAPQAIIMPVFPAAASFIARQIEELPAMSDVLLVGTGGLAGVDTLRTAGDSITGLVYPGIAVSAFGDRYDAFLDRYVAEYGENPPGGFAAYGYDATLLALKAIESVAVKGEDGTLYIGRKALRDAIFATKDLPGLSGDLACDQYGDCGAGSSMVIWEFVSGDPETFEPGKNPRILYPASLME